MRTKRDHLLVLIPVIIVFLGGWRYRWVSDDANIDFRVIQNILHGYGPVFNPGERVEVYTDPLWIALLTAVSGVFTFLSVQWWSVVLGLVLTVEGFWLAGLATISFAKRNDDNGVIPIGLICISVVGGVWMFATSGLETGMIFGWLGLSWWLLVRALCQENRGLYLTAVVLSLGFTIRPDMVLFTMSEGVVLGLLLFHNAARGTSVKRRKVILLVFSLVAIPIISELFRVAYFGLLVSNTSLAKSAASSYWSQGFKYAWNFIRPYYLFIPTLFLGAISVARLHRWWQRGIRLDLADILAPVVGGTLDILYVVRLGGDFMHARMLLPGFFSLFAVGWISWPLTRKTIYPAFGVGVVVWAAICLVSLRYTVPGVGNDMIANERAYYIYASGSAYPIQPSDYPNWQWYLAGRQLQQAASRVPQGKKEMTLDQIGVEGPYYPVTSDLPESLYVDLGNIGVKGLAAGDKVYVFDELSLANPVGSHITLARRGRPGHEKYLAISWMIARFSGPQTWQSQPGALRQNIMDAHAAMQCQPLAGYLSAITGPLTWTSVLHDFEHSFTWTTMSFSADPSLAREQLCGNVAVQG